MTEQQLADEIVKQFIAKCEHLWPGVVVAIRTGQDRNQSSEFWTQSKNRAGRQPGITEGQ